MMSRVARGIQEDQPSAIKIQLETILRYLYTAGIDSREPPKQLAEFFFNIGRPIRLPRRQPRVFCYRSAQTFCVDCQSSCLPMIATLWTGLHIKEKKQRPVQTQA